MPTPAITGLTSLSINTVSPTDSSNGFYVPQLTNAQMKATVDNGIARNGGIIYNTDTKSFYGYVSGTWGPLNTGGGGGNVTGPGTSVVGHIAIFGNNTGTVIADGGPALVFIDTGATSQDLFLGISAGPSDPGNYGTNNIAIGVNALQTNTSNGNYNIAIGTSALVSNTDGTNNTAIGYSALAANSISSNNTAIGFSALTSNQNGSNNTALGFSALAANNTGSNNTAIGFSALTANNTGNSLTAIGFNANVGGDGFSNATAIGANATVSASNSLVLGSGANVGIGTSTPKAALHVSGGQISNVTPITANYTVLGTDYIIAVRDVSASPTVTLPASTTNNVGQVYIVKDESGNAGTTQITINVDGGGTIDGGTTATIATGYGSLRFYGDNNQWYTF